MNLQERISDEPEMKISLEKACKNFNENSCKKVTLNQITKFILDSFTNYQLFKCPGIIEINVEEQTFIIWVTNLISNLCILVPFIGRFLYKRSKLYFHRKYNSNGNENSSGNVNDSQAYDTRMRRLFKNSN